MAGVGAPAWWVVGVLGFGFFLCLGFWCFGYLVLGFGLWVFLFLGFGLWVFGFGRSRIVFGLEENGISLVERHER